MLCLPFLKRNSLPFVGLSLPVGLEDDPHVLLRRPRLRASWYTEILLPRLTCGCDKALFIFDGILLLNVPLVGASYTASHVSRFFVFFNVSTIYSQQ